MGSFILNRKYEKSLKKDLLINFDLTKLDSEEKELNEMKKILTLLIISCLVAFSSCKKKDMADNPHEARQLFNESVELLNETIRQIELSTDSLSIDSLESLYNKKITNINFSLPSLTDYKITEEENDSIYKLILKVKKIKDEKLKSFKKGEEEKDTLFKD